MKKYIIGMVVTVAMLVGSVSGVHAFEETSVQGVLDEIQKVAETEEEVREEILDLSVNELNEIDAYLKGKPDITMGEKVILETVKDVMYSGDSLEYAIQDNIQEIELENSLKEEAKEIGFNMESKERDELLNKIAYKSERTLEEQMLYKGLTYAKNYEITKVILIVNVSLIVIGVILLMLGSNKEEYEELTYLDLLGFSSLFIGVFLNIPLLVVRWGMVMDVIKGLISL